MIVTVTCNPAVDVTYRVSTLTPGEVHRVSAVTERVGGKGVNVARVLHQLGEAVVATGLADHHLGPSLESSGIAAAFVPALPSVRRTLVVHSDDTTTGLWEPGPEPHDPHAAEQLLVTQVESLLVGAQALVVSGSLPARIDPAMPAKLARLARDRDLPVVLDLDDEPLRQAATERGAVLVPNLDELHRLVDRTEDLDVVRAARDLHSRTGAPVVVTLGADGMVAVTDDRCWHAVAPEPVRGNATGAGDAAVAAIVRGLVRGDDWPAVLADAVALSAAAVASPVAGDVDLAAYRAVRDRVSARPVNSYTTGRRQPR